MWDELLAEFLRQGQWSEAADDNANREALTLAFLSRLVDAYAKDPGQRDAQRALGLFVLALGVAEWGVSDPDTLFDPGSDGTRRDTDPAGRSWASDSIGDSGKHLMAYALGGIGISHADGGEFVDFVRRIADLPDLSPEQRQELLNVVDRSRYSGGKVTFDQLRAASVCRAGTLILGDDLFGVPFRHHTTGGGTTYCARFFISPDLTARDWTVFRTWARFAMRRAETQHHLIERWMELYWDKSLAQMRPGEGREEEAFINVRFRNSFSGAAAGVAAAADKPVVDRIALQMDRYRERGEERFRRRVDIIQRPIVLYRRLLGKPPIPKYHL